MHQKGFRHGPVFFTNSGAEAIEGALKAARKYAYLKDGRTDHEIIAMEPFLPRKDLRSAVRNRKSPLPGGVRAMIGNIRFAELNDFDSVMEQVNDRTCRRHSGNRAGRGRHSIPRTENF